MKILQVTPRYAPNTGGVETHVQEISERLVERGHEVTVVTADAGSGVRARETRNGVRIRRHRGFAPGDAFHLAPGIVVTVRRADADVVHAHNYHSLPLFFATLGVSDKRFVVTPHYHGASANDFRDRLLSLYRPIGRWLLRRADAMVAVSEWERNHLRKDFDVEATVIPNGLDVDRFSNADPEIRDQPYLLCVGRQEEYKGTQHAIRALVELPDFELVVAGCGPYRDELERIAREVEVADRVDFLGFVAADRLPGLYAGADVFLSLSAFEAYGITIGEALAAGTPCIVRESGALVHWTDRADCVGTKDMSPGGIAKAVRETVRRTAPSDPLPGWDEVTERILTCYE